MKLFSLSLCVWLFLSCVLNAQIKEYEDNLGDLMKERNAAIDKVEAEFAKKVDALRQKLVVDLEAELANAMRQLDLKRSNTINEQIAKYRAPWQKPDNRNLFLRTDESGEPSYFIRGYGSDWIERNATHCLVHQQTESNEEYIEVIFPSNGSTHRLYKNKNTNKFPPKGQKSFQFLSRGVWLDSFEQLLDERPGLPSKSKKP